VFVGVAAVMSMGISLREAFTGYAAVPLVIAAAAATMWPRKPVPAKVLSADGIAMEQKAPLEGRSLTKQLLSLEFILFTWTVSVTMVTINFFIATCLGQMSEVNTETSLELTHAFASILPAGGIVFIPIIGKIIDSCGPPTGYLVLWTCLVLFQVLLTLYASTGNDTIAYAAFVAFAFCRPLFYTVGASFCGSVFGFATFGKVYGLCNTVAGIANLAVAPLGALADEKGFRHTNLLLTIAQMSTIGLPLYMIFRFRGDASLEKQPSTRARAMSYSTPYQDLGRKMSYSASHPLDESDRL